MSTLYDGYTGVLAAFGLACVWWTDNPATIITGVFVAVVVILAVVVVMAALIVGKRSDNE